MNSMRILRMSGAPALALSLFLAACGDGHKHGDGPGEHRHDDGHSGHEEHGDHGHGHGATGERGGGGAVTLFTPKAELFMEFQGLVVGMETRFAAHLTLLHDYKPVTRGRVEMEFFSAEGGRMLASAEAPSSPGIFRPEVKPTKAGNYRAVLRVSGPQLVDSFVVENLKVTDKPLPSEAEEESPNEISFLKEQAWKIPFRTETAVIRELAQSLAVYGETAPASGKHAAVATPVTGIVSAGGAALAAGAQVRAGQVLLRIAPPAPGTEGWVAFTESREAARIAQSEYEKAKRLHEKGAISLSQLQEAERAFRVSQAGTREYQVKAPISGVIAKVNAVPGAQVTAGETLVEILDPSVLWVKANLPLASASALRQVEAARVRLPAGDGDTAVPGKMLSAGTAVDPITKAIPLVFSIRNPDGWMRAGIPVTVDLLLRAKQSVLAVPEGALYDDDGKFAVYIQTGGESFEKRLVEKGIASGGWVEIRSGLEAGDRVVSVGGYQVRMASLSTSVPAHGHAH